MIVDLAMFAIFLSLFMVVWLIGSALLPGRKPKPDNRDIFVAPIFGAVTQGLAFVVPVRKKKREQIQKDLLAAGRYHNSALINFLATRNLFLLAVIVLIVSVVCFEVLPGVEIVVSVIGFVVAAVVFALPPVVLNSMAKGRKNKIEKAIPDVLDLVAMAVAGGMPIASALQKVNSQISKTYPALASELTIICNQSRAGSIEAAFEKLSHRIQIPEIVSWASLMKQSQRLGGGIADALQQYANRIREDRNNRIERQGNTASIKLLLPVVLCICPPIAVMLIGPALLDFRDFLKREGETPSAAISQFNEARQQARLIDVETRSN